MRFLLRFGGWIATAGLLVLLVASIVAWSKRRSEVQTVSDEQKLGRSLHIIRSSTPEVHRVLKVLFYGQSITRSGWDKAVVEHWVEKYPNTVFVVQNRALGGFSALQLERTTDEDIAAFYPDMIVFHVYGDNHAYERIIRLFRSKTAADIIVQTDHGEVLPDPPCSEGLRMTIRRPAGCVGFLWLKQRLWSDEMSYHIIPGLAKKYGLAMEPQRGWWRDYLLRTHIDPQSMLVDKLHPNDAGKELIAAFFNRYFDSLVEGWNGQEEHNVSSFPPDALRASNGQEALSFEGSRVELLSSKPLPAWPKVLIDGVQSNDIDGCYEVTRASSIGTVKDWPAVRRISLQHDHVSEEWKATLTKISEDQKRFEFNVKSASGGDEGQGDSAHDFVSRSGKLRIEAQDWMIERAFDLSKAPLQAPFEVSWSVTNVCNGPPEITDLGNGTMQYRYVLGAGLENKGHALTLSYPANDLAAATELRVYRPPLHQ